MLEDHIADIDVAIGVGDLIEDFITYLLVSICVSYAALSDTCLCSLDGQTGRLVALWIIEFYLYRIGWLRWEIIRLFLEWSHSLASSILDVIFQTLSVWVFCVELASWRVLIDRIGMGWFSLAIHSRSLNKRWICLSNIQIIQILVGVRWNFWLRSSLLRNL